MVTNQPIKDAGPLTLARPSMSRIMPTIGTKKPISQTLAIVALDIRYLLELRRTSFVASGNSLAQQ